MGQIMGKEKTNVNVIISDEWMHLAFSWKRQEGLWVFLNGELVGANVAGTSHIRNYDRYNRITMGRNNANNNFGAFMRFAFQEIAVYFKFTVTYRIREIFALTGIFFLFLYFGINHIISIILMSRFDTMPCA
mgnify:FL=1